MNATALILNVPVQLDPQPVGPYPGSFCDFCQRDYQTVVAVVYGKAQGLVNATFRAGLICQSCLHSLDEVSS